MKVTHWRQALIGLALLALLLICVPASAQETDVGPVNRRLLGGTRRREGLDREGIRNRIRNVLDRICGRFGGGGGGGGMGGGGGGGMG